MGFLGSNEGIVVFVSYFPRRSNLPFSRSFHSFYFYSRTNCASADAIHRRMDLAADKGFLADRAFV